MWLEVPVLLKCVSRFEILCGVSILPITAIHMSARKKRTSVYLYVYTQQKLSQPKSVLHTTKSTNEIFFCRPFCFYLKATPASSENPKLKQRRTSSFDAFFTQCVFVQVCHTREPTGLSRIRFNLPQTWMSLKAGGIVIDFDLKLIL